MFTEIDPSTIRPLKRVEFEALARQGAFDDERVELLYGMVVRMSPVGPAHNYPVEQMNKLLVLGVGDRARVRPGGSVELTDDSEPLPDFALFAPGAPDDEAFLVVEVSDSSLAKDQKLKRRLYAEARIPEYWIVNIPKRCIEVHRDPMDGAYTTTSVHARGDSVTMLKFPDVTIRVSDVIR